MRKIIINSIGILILILGFFINKQMTKEKTEKAPEEKKIIPSVLVQKVQNQNLPLEVSISGKLSAKEKVELFAEVQGVFEPTGKDFKPGVAYQRGETLVRINSDEFRASIKAKKSSLFNTISSLMPDMKMDFPESYATWENYLSQFDVNSTLKPLPNYQSDKEKYFVAAKNVSVLYYDIKNLEEKLAKYTINAPFNGIVSQAMVNKGTLIRAGQKLGELIDPSVYELEISLGNAIADFLNIGDKVLLKNLDESKQWQGVIIRKNAVVEQSSQTKKVFIKVQSNTLNDGMYLKAFIKSKEQKNVFEIDRSLLIDERFVYIVNSENILSLKEVLPIYFNKNTVIISGLNNGESILSKIIPGAYEGMEVNILAQ